MANARLKTESSLRQNSNKKSKSIELSKETILWWSFTTSTTEMLLVYSQLIEIMELCIPGNSRRCIRSKRNNGDVGCDRWRDTGGKSETYNSSEHCWIGRSRCHVIAAGLKSCCYLFKFGIVAEQLLGIRNVCAKK